MQDAKEEIRSKLNIEDVIGEYVQLKRAGRNFKGLSPFSGEKTPSFVVSPDKQIWHDFSSNKGGDLFTFVMLAEGIDFRQALEQLARKAGVDLSVYESSASQDISKRKKRASEALKLSARYYQESMIKNKHAIEYIFKKRKLAKQSLEDFAIGYSPSTGDALTNYLIKKGFDKQSLIDAGLLNRFDNDLFRGRMMIPLMSGTGEIIGFTARMIYEEPNSPKYLNTPQTILYDKSSHVFGLSQAKEAIKKFDEAVIVEGNLDVVSSHQSGTKQVVATAGTAMTENHLKVLSRLTKNLKLAFDGDKAGLAATERAIGIAQGMEVELSIVSLPEDVKDPDELIQKDKALWIEAIANSRPAIDWVIDQYESREDLSTSVGKKRFSEAALGLIKALTDKVEQEHYLKIIAVKIDTTFSTLLDKLSESKNSKTKLKSVAEVKIESPDENFLMDNLLAVAMIDSATYDLFVDFDINILEGENRIAVMRHVIESKGKVINKIPVSLQNYETYVKILLLKAETRYAEWSSQDRYYETARLLRQVIIQNKKKQKDLLNEELRIAESNADDSRAEELRKKINQLIKEISSGK